METYKNKICIVFIYDYQYINYKLRHLLFDCDQISMELKIEKENIK